MVLDVKALTWAGEAPLVSPPMRQAVAIKDAVLPSMALR